MATVPNGDKNGDKSSVMNGLIKKLHLDDILRGISLKTNSDNLEDIYSELHSRPDCQEAVAQLEQALYDYFAALELPDYPTIYDYLVLSLTNKDAIAIFNWDPLLFSPMYSAQDNANSFFNRLDLYSMLMTGIGDLLLQKAGWKMQRITVTQVSMAT